MYLDYSLRKLGTLFTLIVVLLFFVYSTHAAKMEIFGSTPYFYSISHGVKYALQSFAASFARVDAATSTAEKASGIPILTYHRVLDDEDVNNVTVARFRDQMETLKRAGWETVSLQEYEDFIAGTIDLPEKSFLLTFDDGAKQSFYPVDPILKELGYEAAIFIIVQSSKTPESTYYMTPEEIRRMLRTGRWQIGSHSYDGHRPYPSDAYGTTTAIFFADRIWRANDSRLETPDEFAVRVKDDLTRSKNELEATYDVPIRTFAFPLGNETGILGADNYADGAAITESIARSIYDIGFVQTDLRRYTFNFPSTTTDYFNPSSPFARDKLRSAFLGRRIHVDYDWDGARLLEIMENGRAKPLPFEDDFSRNEGWIPAWGSMQIGRNNFELQAESGMTSASSFLDGSMLWNNYSFDAKIAWESGYAIALADVLDSKTYHACAFSPGEVRLQRTIDGETVTVQTKKDPRISFGTATVGVRVHDYIMECTWNFESIVEDYSREFSGGVGIQTWDPEPGAARLRVESVIARPFATTTAN